MAVGEVAYDSRGDPDLLGAPGVASIRTERLKHPMPAGFLDAGEQGVSSSVTRCLSETVHRAFTGV
jgi:hypothetical protein